MNAGYEEMQAKIDAEILEKQKATLAFIGQANRAVLMQEYAERGIDPVYADEECEVVISLPMMLHMGWRIEQVDGRSALVREGA